MTAWTAADSIDISDEFVMDGIRERWQAAYDIGYADGGYHAFHLIDRKHLTADTPAGLESVLMADWYRRGLQ